MRYFVLSAMLCVMFGCSNSQSSVDPDYTKGFCNCLDSLNKTTNTNHSFPDCFGAMLDRNSSAVRSRATKEYGSASQANLEKVMNELEIEVSIDLIDSCTTYFRFIDSLKHQQYKNLNKDSLVNLLKGLSNFDTIKNSKTYYVRAATLCYQLGDYETASKNADRVLSEDSTNVTALFIKAFAYDTRGNYQNALTLYDKVARLSHQSSFYIYSALARRKKNGL